MSADATFYTVSDAGFFPGSVALLNSLRLSGHREDLVVLDSGLTPEQRRRLAEHTIVVDRPAGLVDGPYFVKPYPFALGATGTVVLIDSDMIVARSLARPLALAAEGKICLFPDAAVDQGRWFAEWEQGFQLSAPLRHQTYLNAGFVALSVEHWPCFLERWSAACSLIPPDRHFTREDQLFRDGDQDAINAILMSEIAASSIEKLPEWGELYADGYDATITDEERLVCVRDGKEASILHHSGRPKVWQPTGRSRLSVPEPYVRLLPRVLFGDDVVLRLDRRDVPWWVLPRTSSRLGVTAVDAFDKARGRLAVRTRLANRGRIPGG
jgi:hypothetical protein